MKAHTKHFRCPRCRAVVVKNAGPSPVVTAELLFALIAHVVMRHGRVR